MPKQDRPRPGDRNGGEEDECCSIVVIPFDCNEPTCECTDAFRSEAGGVRSDNQKDAAGSAIGDSVRVAYRVVSARRTGRFHVQRTHPTKLEKVGEGSFVTSERENECKEIERCARVLEVQGTPRPIHLGDATIFDTTSKLRPFEAMERYEVTLVAYGRGDTTCTAVHKFSVVDCDQIVLCYALGRSRARVDYFRFPLPPDRLTFREFGAILGETGARALCEAYFQSVTQCTRTFRNPSWAGCVSAVLAEEFYKAYIEFEALDPEWQDFFRLGDVEITRRADAAKLDQLGKAFGRAHLELGLRKAIAQCGSNPCCSADLATVARILTAVQRPLLENVTIIPDDLPVIIPLPVKPGAPPIPIPVVIPAIPLNWPAGWFGLDPVSQFKAELRKNMLAGLRAAGANRCAAELRRLFDAEPD